jgi:hypothetical protein
MNQEPHIVEGLPRISMDPHVFYKQSAWEFGFFKGWLSDRKISHYLKTGRYNRAHFRPHPSGGTVIWSA